MSVFLSVTMVLSLMPSQGVAEMRDELMGEPPSEQAVGAVTASGQNGTASEGQDQSQGGDAAANALLATPTGGGQQGTVANGQPANGQGGENGGGAGETTPTPAVPAEPAATGTPEHEKSADLRDFVTEVSIEGATSEDGKTVVKEGVAYEVRFTFAEKADDKQFDDEAEWTYALPAGFSAAADQPYADKPLVVRYTDAEGEEQELELPAGAWRVDGSVVRVTWRVLGERGAIDDETLSRLAGASDLEFGLRVTGAFAPDATSVDFGRDPIDLRVDRVEGVNAPGDAATAEQGSGANAGDAANSANAGNAAQPDAQQPFVLLPQSDPSSDLKNYITNVVIDGVSPSADGELTVKEGESYQVSLYFGENADRQFSDDTAEMTYAFPDGFDAVSIGSASSPETLDITVTYTEDEVTKTATVTGNQWYIKDGVLHFKWNDSDSTAFEKLKKATNAEFHVSVKGSFTDVGKKIDFGVQAVDIIVDTTHEVSVQKWGSFNKNTGKIDYTVTVTSKGKNTQVEVKDTLTSASSSSDKDKALSIDATSVKAKSNKTGDIDLSGMGSVASSGGQNTGYTYTIPSMSDGEVITFNYSAAVDFKKIDPEGKGTITQTENGVAVKSEKDPEGDRKTFHQEHQINYTSMQKTQEGQDVKNGGVVTRTFKVVANAEALVPMADMDDRTVTDVIGADSQDIMKFSGTGIRVTKYQRDPFNAGNWVSAGTYNVPWSQMSKSDSVWSYQLPADTTPYKYEITYTADVDLTGKTGKNYNIKNTVDGPGDPVTYTGTVENPSDTTVNLKKEVTGTTTDAAGNINTISWKASFDVPASGLTKAVVKDTYPSAYLDGEHGWVIEAIKSGTLRVSDPSGIIGNNYSVAYNDDNVTITFFRDAAKTAEGIVGSGSSRTVTVELTTDVNQDWVDKSETATYLREHKNTVVLDANGEVSTATASQNIAKQTINKGISTSWDTVDGGGGVRLPVYSSYVIISGVNDGSFAGGPLTIKDEFDTSILKPRGGTFKIYGGDQYNQGYGGNAVAYQDQSYGMDITVNRDAIPKDSNGQYYSFYKIVYDLQVKDADALRSLKEKAAQNGGSYSVTNEAAWGELKVKVGTDYSYGTFTKEMLTNPSKLIDMPVGDRTLNFRLTVNKECVDLSRSGETVTLTDVMSDTLSFNYDSVLVEVYDASGALLLTKDASGSVNRYNGYDGPVPTWDTEGYALTLVIPDDRKVVINYSADVVKTGEIKNVARLNGEEHSVVNQAKVKDSSGGTASLYSIKLKKYAAGDQTHTLEGAKFELYHGTNGQGTDGRRVVSANGGTDANVPNDGVFVTGANGLVTIGDSSSSTSWSPLPDHWYFLREVDAPANHRLLGYDVKFRISSTGVPEYDKYIYTNNGTIAVKNYEGTQVPVSKVWTDGTARHAGDKIKVRLLQKIGDGEYSANVKVPPTDESSAWVDYATKEVVLSADNNWEYLFKDLPVKDDREATAKDITYYVEEVFDDTYPVIDGRHYSEADSPYTTKYQHTDVKTSPASPQTVEFGGSDADLDAKRGTYTNGRSIIVKNERETGNLDVTKTVTSPSTLDAADRQREFSFTVTLYKDDGVTVDTSINGTFEAAAGKTKGMTFTNGVATFTLKDGETASATQLPAGTKYSVTETHEDGFITTWTNTTGGKTYANSFAQTWESENIGSGYAYSPSKETQTVTVSDGTSATGTHDLSYVSGKDLDSWTKDDASTAWMPEGTAPRRGTIATDVTDNATFTNRREYGGFDVHKEVESDIAADKTKDFTFRVELADRTISGTYGEMEFTNGVATFTLKHGEKKSASGLPKGLRYYVYEVVDGGFNANDSNANGKVGYVMGYKEAVDSNNGVSLSFVDRDTGQPVESTPVKDGRADTTYRNDRKEGRLKVTKTVKSSQEADKNLYFKFKVTLPDNTSGANSINQFYYPMFQSSSGDWYVKTEDDYKTQIDTGKKDENGNPIYESVFDAAAEARRAKEVLTFTNGVAEFYLKDGETRYWGGLPAGVRYEVTETAVREGESGSDDENKLNDFTQTWSGQTGTFASDVIVPAEEGQDFDTTVDMSSNVTCTNTRDDGGLQVTKSVSSMLAADRAREFNFKVVLDGTADANKGKHGDMTFAEGTGDDAGKLVATFTLKDGETAAAPQLAVGTKFTVYETDNLSGEFVTSWSDNVAGDHTIKSNQTAKVTCTNSREPGSLKVHKIVESSRGADKLKDFSFTIELADSSISGTFNATMRGANGAEATRNVTFTNGVATLTLKDGESLEVKDLPVGLGYTVREESVLGFTTTTSGVTKYSYKTVGDGGEEAQVLDSTYTEGTIVKDADPQTAGNQPSTVDFTNKHDEGNLKVEKTVESPFLEQYDKDVEFTFTVTLDSNINGTFGKVDPADTTGMTFTNGVATFTLKHGQKASAANLPADTGYTVTEVTPQGHVATWTGNTNGTIVKGETQTVDCKNKRQTGELDLKKVVSTHTQHDREWDYAFTVTLSHDQLNETFGMSVIDENGNAVTNAPTSVTFSGGKATVKLKDGQTAKIDGLPVGIGYEVAEESVRGMTVAWSGETGEISTTPSVATCTNRRQEGHLKVTKHVVGAKSSEANNTYHFKVTLDHDETGRYYWPQLDDLGNIVYEEDGVTPKLDTSRYMEFTSETVEENDQDVTRGVAEFDLKDGESNYAMFLPSGMGYTVTETAKGGFTATWRGKTSATIQRDTINELECDNTRDKGNLEVTKEVVSSTESDKGMAFTFNVELLNSNNARDTEISGTYGDMTFDRGLATFTLSDGGKALAEGLPSGTRYKVTETTPTGFTTTWTGTTTKNGTTKTYTESDPLPTNETYQGDITKDKTATINCKNTRDEGGIKVSKKVTGALDGEKNRTFTITVTLDKGITGTYGQMTFNSGVATFSIKNGQTVSADNLPAGTHYVVSESDAGNFTAKWKNETGTIPGKNASGPAFATVECENVRDDGGLKVEKTVVSDATDDKEKPFNFKVTLDDTSISGTFSGVTFTNGVSNTFALKHGQSKTIEKLPAGIGYTVEEERADGFITTKTGETGKIAKGTTATASFTNSITPGTLNVKKTVDSPDDADKSKAFEFTVTLKREDGSTDAGISKKFGGMTFNRGVAKFTLTDGETKTASGLPTGIDYTVEETRDGGFVTTSTGTTGADALGTTVKGTISSTPSTASYVNKRQQGGLMIHKTVRSAAADDHNQPFTFTVKLPDNTGVNGTYGDMTFTNGSATLTLRDGGTAYATGLPRGIRYVVSENTPDGYVASWSGETVENDKVEGTVPTNTYAQVFCTNERMPGNLTVQKVVDSTSQADKDSYYDFKVTLKKADGSTDTSISGRFADANSSDPAARNGMIFSKGVAELKLKSGEQAQAIGLPLGIQYSVEETTPAGFTVSWTGNATAGTGSQANGRITSVPSEVVFTNSRKPGRLDVTKTVISDASHQAEDEAKYFSFKVTLSDTTVGATSATSSDGVTFAGADGTAKGMTFKDGVAKFTLRHGETASAIGLPAGVDYEVVEVGASTTDAYTEDASTIADYAKTARGNTGTIGEGTDASSATIASFTNRRTLGLLTLYKYVSSDLASDHNSNKKFKFMVNVRKNEAVPVDDGDYDITTYRADGTTDAGKVTFSDGKAEVMLADGEEADIQGLPAHSTYVVTEEGADDYLSGSVDSPIGTIVDSQSNATPAMTGFFNSRARGNLELEKELVSEAAVDADLTFNFRIDMQDADGSPLTTVDGDYGDVSFYSGVANVSIKGGEKVVAEGLPSTARFTISETAVDAEGVELDDFNRSWSGDVSEAIVGGTQVATGSIKANEVERAVCTNTRVPGGLKVVKAVDSDAAADKEQEFAFTVTLADTTIGGAEGKWYGTESEGMLFKNGVATFSLADGQSKLAEGLPTGIDYTVTEETPDGFVATWRGESGTIADPAPIVTITNKRELGGLEVTKTVATDTPSDRAREFAFRVTLGDEGINGTYGDMVFQNGVATFSLADGQAKVADGLPTDLSYTVEEETAKGFVVTKTGETGKIAKTAPTAAFTNTREYGDLEVAKTVESGLASDKDKEFEFTVTLDDATIDGTFGEMDFKAGVATFKLKDGQAKKAVRLPVGIGYTVAEGADESGRFTTTAQGEHGEISTTLSRAAFTNTAPKGTASLGVTKKVAGNDYEGDEEFAFTLTKADEKTSDVLPADATASAKAGERATFGDITYYEEGTYYYNISEVEPEAKTAGMAYDATAHWAKVVVERVGGESRLRASSVVYGESKDAVDGVGAESDVIDTTGATDTAGATGATEELTITNTYTRTTASLVAKKKLQGRELKDGEFSFELRDEKGKVLQTKKNDAQGNIVFDAIEYTESGTHSYVIVEVNDAQANVSYDRHEAKVKVQVKTDEKGGLAASTTYDSATGAAFTNTYTPPSTPRSSTKPSIRSPQTGDPADLLALQALAATGALGVFVGALKRRRRR